MKPSVLAFLSGIGFSATAQQPITKATFNPKETYTLQYPTGQYKHPEGYDVATVVVLAKSTGAFYRVAIRQEHLQALKPGEEVVIRETEVPDVP